MAHALAFSFSCVFQRCATAAIGTRAEDDRGCGRTSPRPAAWPGSHRSRRLVRMRSSSSSSAVHGRTERVRIRQQAGRGQQLVDEADAEADGGARLPARPRTAGTAFRRLRPGGRERPAGRDAATSGRPRRRASAEAGEGLGRLAGVAGGDDQRARARPPPAARSRDARSAARAAGRRPRRPPARRRWPSRPWPARPPGRRRGAGSSSVTVAATRRAWASWRGMLGDARQHVSRVDRREHCRVVEGDRLLEQRRPVAVAPSSPRGRGRPGSSSGCL